MPLLGQNRPDGLTERRRQAADALAAVADAAFDAADFRSATAAIRAMVDLEGLALTPEAAEAADKAVDAMSEAQQAERRAELEARAAEAPGVQ